MKAAVLWTGGKDSYLALCHAISKHNIICLVTFVPENNSFKAHPIQVIEKQANSLQIPLLKLTVNKPYKEGYIKAIKQLKEELKIELLITGDIAEVDGHPNWIKECATQAGVSFLVPLWGNNRKILLDEILHSKTQVIFSLVKEPFLNVSWVGRKITTESVKELQRVHLENGMDICGENGEFHTIVLDGDLFTSPISLERFEVCSEKGMHYLSSEVYS